MAPKLKALELGASLDMFMLTDILRGLSLLASKVAAGTGLVLPM